MPMRKVNQNSKIIYLNSPNTMNINKDELMKLSRDELINMLGDRKHCQANWNNIHCQAN